MVRNCAGILVMAASLAALVGCGSSGAAPTAKVSGTVTVDGTPVSGATVTFTPAPGTKGGGRQANGSTDAAGKYKLSSFAKEDGAMPGDYTVIVSGTGVPAKYSEANVADMKKKVDAGKANVIDLQLTN